MTFVLGYFEMRGSKLQTPHLSCSARIPPTSTNTEANQRTILNPLAELPLCFVCLEVALEKNLIPAQEKVSAIKTHKRLGRESL
jgi:hypothetical protein